MRDLNQRDRPTTLAFGGLLALAAAIGVGRFVYTPILPPMSAALRLTTAQAGLIASSNYLGYLVGAIVSARSNLRWSRRSWLIGSLLVSAVTTAAMGVASTLLPFLAIRFIGGLASAFVLVFASGLVLDRLAAMGRSGLSAVYFAGVGAGIACSAALVTGLAFQGAGWRILWVASGGLSLAAALAVAWLIPVEAGDPAQAKSNGGSPPARGALALLIAAYGLFGFGYVITATFLVAIVRGTPETQSLEPFVWLIVGMTAAPSVLLWVRAARRIGVLVAFAAACLIEAVGVAASVMWMTAASVLVAAVFLGGTFIGITALGLIGARDLSSGDRRRSIALATAAFGLGQIVGPSFAGIVRDATSSFLLPSLAGSGALLAAAAFALGAAGAAKA